MLLDSMVNFRLEYLYPILMFVRSVYDSYKYQGFVSVHYCLKMHYQGLKNNQSYQGAGVRMKKMKYMGGGGGGASHYSSGGYNSGGFNASGAI